MTAISLPPGSSRALDRNFPAYIEIVRGRLKVAIAYRQNSLFLLAIVVVQIFILKKVWTALYAHQTSVSGVDRHALLVYLTIANIQGWVLQDPTVSRYMYERVRQGLVAFDLVRPSGFIQQMFAQLAGSTLSSMMFVLPALPIIYFAGTLGAPASWSAAGVYVASLACGYVITMMLMLIIGMIAFWTTEILGLTMLYRLVSQFFAGALVPLTFFPGALRVLAEALPFQSTVYVPVAIYVGRLHGLAMLQAIVVQIAWIAGLSLAAWAMWRRALFRVVVQGG